MPSLFFIAKTGKDLSAGEKLRKRVRKQRKRLLRDGDGVRKQAGRLGKYPPGTAVVPVPVLMLLFRTRCPPTLSFFLCFVEMRGCCLNLHAQDMYGQFG